MRIKQLILSKINKYHLLTTIFFIYLTWPTRFALIYYENYNLHEIEENLVNNAKIVKNSTNPEQIHCSYRELFQKNQFFYKEPFISDILNKLEIRSGGEYWPSSCIPAYSTAIIVCYRNRPEQLRAFLTYFHNFLRKQQIHYKIFVVEQVDSKLFNRAKLFNIGAKYAIREKFPCLIMHDVDLMPLRLGNIYACTHRPRHMSSSIDKFRYTLPYYGLFGGAVAIHSNTFNDINGFSNSFQGWGGEDDDLYARLVHKRYKIIRFHPNVAQYIMLTHKQETPNADRIKFLKSGYLRYDTDGLNSLDYKEIAVQSLDLYTNIKVEV